MPGHIAIETALFTADTWLKTINSGLRSIRSRSPHYCQKTERAADCLGLGAHLLPPASLVLDRSGIYYDPGQPSDLEILLSSGHFDEDILKKARKLRGLLCSLKVSKYNVGNAAPLPVPSDKHIILVPAQVEDDASIRTGTSGSICTNLELLKATRNENPDAHIIFKPHPDVEAGKRAGNVPKERVLHYADQIASNHAPVPLVEQADAVWTMTSLIGFEALLRKTPVTCFGMPFYAGWGLTNDRMSLPPTAATMYAG